MSNLGKKRLDAAIAIATYAVGSATAAYVPTPGGQLPKQLVLTASDILMYTKIWKLYFEEELSGKSVMEMLTELGLVTVAATGTAYIVCKGTTAIINEISNWAGPLGWGISATIAGSLSGMCGATWAIYCDYTYMQKHPDAV